MFFSYGRVIKAIRIKKHKTENKKKTNQIIKGSISLRVSNHKKRTFYTSSYIKQKASLTVEAAMTVPLFLSAFFLLLYSFKVIELQSKIQYAMNTTASEMAAYAVIKEDIPDGKIMKYAGNIVYSNSGAGVLFLKNLKSHETDIEMVSNKWMGFSFSSSKILNKDSIIYLKVKYKIKLPQLLGLNITIPCVQCTYTRGFTGKTLKESRDGKIVYVTTGQTVYHTNRNCTHLVLSIRQVEKTEFFRRKSGYLKKYSQCTLCKNKEAGAYVYITGQGDKYHSSLMCKSLKRTIKRILWKETGNRSLCKRCSEGG